VDFIHTHTCKKGSVMFFNSIHVYFVQPIITNYKFASKGFTIWNECTYKDHLHRVYYEEYSLECIIKDWKVWSLYYISNWNVDCINEMLWLWEEGVSLSRLWLFLGRGSYFECFGTWSKTVSGEPLISQGQRCVAQSLLNARSMRTRGYHGSG